MESKTQSDGAKQDANASARDEEMKAMAHTGAMLSNMMTLVALRALLDLQVFDAMPDHGAMHVSALSSKTGATSALLTRLLRVAAASGIVNQIEQDEFSQTAVSRGYNSDSIATTSFINWHDLGMLTLGQLPAWFEQRGKKEAEGDTCTTHCPHMWLYKREGERLFDVLAEDPKILRSYQVMYEGIAEIYRPVVGVFDYSTLADASSDESGRPLLVDLGGANGRGVAKILKAYPQLRPESFVVQDLPPSIESAKNNPNLPKGVQLQVHDFFESQPVRHAKAYQWSSCFHDYSDEVVVKMLEQVVPVMANDSKVLIPENVLPDVIRKGQHGAYLDMLMMTYGGKERTQTNWKRILEQTGLKLDRIHYHAQGSDWAVIEASLA